MHPRRSRALLHVLVVPTSAAVPAACSSAGPSLAPTTGPTTAATTTVTEPPATEIPPDQVTGSLTVLEWPGYEVTDFFPDFAEKYKNVEVTFEFGASDAEQYGHMKAGSQADVFHPYTGWLQFYVDEGLAAEIDTSKLKNWDAVPDAFKAIGQIDGELHHRSGDQRRRWTAGPSCSIPPTTATSQCGTTARPP